MSERRGRVRSGSPRTSSDEPRTAAAAVLPWAVPDRRDRTWLARISIVAAIVVVTLGLLGFAGWIIGPSWLSELLPGTLPIKANAAVSLVLLGAALCLSVAGFGPRSRLVRALALVVLFISTATAVEYVTGIDLGIDRFLAADTATPGAPYPGRMAVGAMVSFIAAALALLSMGRSWRGWHPSTVLAGVVAAVGGLGTLGYAYGSEQFTRIGSTTQIAFPAALALLVLSVGLVAAGSEQGFMRALTDRELSGQLTRRFLPTALLVVPFSVWLMLQFEHDGVWTERDGAAVVVTFEIFLLAVIGVWITSRTLRLEDSRKEARRERDGLFDTSDDLICAVDAEGLFILVSPSWTRLMGYEPGDLLGRPLSGFVLPDELGPTMEEPFGRAEFSERVSGHVNRCRARDGTYRWFEWNGSRDPETGRIFAAGRDISDRKQAEFKLLKLNAELEERAMRDPLTGLANRRLLDELLAASLSRVERSSEPVQVVYVDLNDFKAVNDIHGHAAGDAVLQETARRFKAAVRVGDIVARVGGDEFVLVLQPAVDAFEAFRTRVDCALAEPIDVGGGIKVSCTASIGLADSRTTGTDPARLLSAADANMYARKSAAPKR